MYTFYYDNGIKTKHKTLISPKTMKKENKNAKTVKIYYENLISKIFINELYFYESEVL